MMPDLSFLHASLFYELAALLVLAATIGLVGQVLRQPLIVSFIACGILAGPSALGIVRSPENIDLLAELGVAVLLFLIGLKLDLKLIRASGSVALTAGLGQVFVTALLGYGLAALFNLGMVTSFFVALALTFSSTIISTETVGLVTLVGLVTIALSVYMITYSYALYRWLEPLLGIFERSVAYREQQLQVREAGNSYDAILFGLGRYGTAIAKLLREEQVRILAIDFNPEEVRRWTQLGFDTLYGDACDQEFVAALPLEGVRWVIAALPQHELGLTHKDAREVLIEALRARHYEGKIAVATQHLHDVEYLKEKGADVVLLPFNDAAERAVERIASS